MNKLYLFGLFFAAFRTIVKADAKTDLLNDRAQSGNYVMFLCGSGQPNSQAEKLQTLLPYTYQILQEILIDVKLGTASKCGFRSFFKTNANRPYVQSVFEAIAEGQSIQRTSDQSTDSLTNPTLLCANPGPEGSITNTWHTRACIDSPSFARTHTTAALYEPGTNLVILCPHFWNLPTNLTANACPHLVGPRRRRQFSPNDDSLVRSQFGALVHELVHLYNPIEEEEEDGREEVYRIQDLVNLDAQDSVRNAQNYAAYAAGIQAGCGRFPIPPTQVGDELKI